MHPSRSSNPTSLLTRLAIGWLLFFSAGLCRGQTLAIHDDIQTYPTLANTTVTLTGRSELRISNATTPISGCLIHLDSPDAWLFFYQVRPSVVNSTYLSQIRISGANAVLNTNCRVVQYADGTVVIPHSESYTPLQIFSGSHFTGTSQNLQNHTAYNDSNLGSLTHNISSFKLKRGYTATVAQNSDGTGVSRNYVAQDGDIEVNVLPGELNDTISFIRIFPWRWVGKKGIAGNISSGLNVRWDYNWNIDRNSTLDVEYVPIRQTRWWPDLGQNWKTRGANHLLGYNEPDTTEQANLLVGDAIWSWPDLLGSGLRLGSPAPTDGGLSWLYSFMDQADAAKLRVDFVAVHYYRSFTSASDPTGATTQFYNFLKGVYDRVKRPLWVTEWNNGANWTTGPDPTAAQQQATVAKMIEMLDNTPFVERYSLYNWVEDVRRVKWEDGSLTAAGVTYRDKVSPLSHAQVIPEMPTPPTALYRFENDTRDSSANGHPAMLKGGAKFTTGKTGQAVTLSGNAAGGDHVQLPTTLGDSTDFTFGAWVFPTSSAAWQRIFDLGSSTTRYLFLTPVSGSGNFRFGINNGGTEQQLNHNAPLPLNTWSHVAVTISGNTGKLFLNGALVATQTSMTFNPVDTATSNNFLGKSQFAADPLFAGRIDDAQFLNYALSDAKVAAMTTNTPPQFTSASLSGSTATQGSNYSGTLAGSATDPDAGDSITYSRFSGPDWLQISANGTLTGTPGFNQEGNQEFIIHATDSAGASTYSLLTIPLPKNSGNGSWNTDQNGSWNETAKWTGNFPANGPSQIANFSTLNITADRTVTLNGSRTIGALLFGDSSGGQSWTISANTGSNLTLQAETGTPSIAVNQNRATINSPLAGINGFTKSGSGLLILNAENSISGTVNIDTGSTTATEGSLRLTHPGAASLVNAILIRNNNSASSTLELDGTAGPITTGANITVSGRNASLPAILNLSGSNTLSGALNITSGGPNHIIQSDSGVLTLSGTLSSVATGSRTLTVQGTGDTTLTGTLSNGSATTLGIVKNDSGTLALTGNNNPTGPIALNGGTLTFGGSGTIGSGTISLAPGTTLNLQKNLSLTNTVSGAGTIQNTASNTVTGDFSAFTGSYTHNSNVVSTAFNSPFSTSKYASYHLASQQGSYQGFIAGGAGDHTLEMGSLSGIAGSLVRGGNTALGTTTLRIGHLNGTHQFAGSIANGATKTLALEKVGTGTLILSGANSHSGPTSVSAGTLSIDGSSINSTVTVSASGTLAGNGSIGGPITVQSGGALSPGNSIGTLTATGSVTIAGTWVNEIDGATTDRLLVSGTLTLTGSTLDFNAFGTLSQPVYIIASYGSRIGTPTLVDLPTGYSLDTNYNNQKQIALVQSASPFEIWTGQHTLSGDSALPLSDPDQDGIANAIEYVLGLNPAIPALNGLPSVTQSADELAFTFTRVKSTSAEFSPTVETSQSLAPDSWQPVPASQLTIQDNGTTETVTATLGISPSGNLFVRLKVSTAE